MHPIVIAALLLLQTFAPDAYALVSGYEIRTVEHTAYTGTALCGQGVIIVSLPLHTNPEGMAGTLAHEAKHLLDNCPMYDNVALGKRLYREGAAYRYELQVLRLIPGTATPQEWAFGWYWRMWWREHGNVRSLGILP